MNLRIKRMPNFKHVSSPSDISDAIHIISIRCTSE